ncbi:MULTISPECIES: CaiB/BaiF CoA transferase family protein [Paraburkholderia]|uniref:CaiB/BaiF CoA transferase family protein n=1 Tax=Paraburkholderia TaxID=1822464 RepID=UPI001B00BC78|nr:MULTISPECIES: CaiB/BaiF CoA-transferase family protein [Paraburkholderia]MCX4139954.1 CaiB/BaiF CoA-transferase family protein [Paraburkholderia aspalathi]MCX4154915.1 CaiB/BaiF CoA-transferase family protein [Paraburkholderia aspalathi]MDN7164327.1 CoA transferase [Paraburkholderia sp. SECH2]MDQ6392812.1 CoA transferase [Paraburkholderia aspalathi]CAE6829959.1 Acetyl-CoA:oxalate CoA-transferase [Paraburkholderia aspalathi]
MAENKPGVKRRLPLEGITVVDFSRVLSGPYCAMTLADLGARVIKIERVGTGDDTRAFGPFVDNESAYFMCFNRGKESIALDFKSPRDRELLERLLDKADVVVENFRPGVMERLGYGPEQLARTHPHIVYASISGFGHSGPFKDLPGYDTVVQAMGGVMSLTGWPDNQPARVGTAFGDLGAALFAVIGILAGLYKRSKDAQGTHVDIAMLDCQAALMETAFARFDVEAKVPTRTGDAHPSLAPFESFAAQDGRFIIAAGNDQLFLLMADALGVPEVALDPLFLTNDLRVQNRPVMIETVERVTRSAPVSVWLDKLNEAGVPCAPINTIDKVIEHPQLHARNMFIHVQGKSERKVKTAGNPVKMSTSPDEDVTVVRKAPAVDEHREAILAELMASSGAYASQADAESDNDPLKRSISLPA